MNLFPDTAWRVVLIGAGATAVMDAWLFVLQRAGVPTLDFAFLGRWLGHLPRGRWFHAPIAKSPPVRGELALGWLLHYATGIVFAALLVVTCGVQWMQSPSLWPALAWGALTVAAPLLVLQPALGAGVASSKTPTPWKNTLRSLANHLVFGAGLYAAAAVLAWGTR